MPPFPPPRSYAMVLLANLIGSQLSHWMPKPNDDDDQPHRSPQRNENREDPPVLWAVELTDGRKAVLIEGACLFVVRNAMDIRTFDGPSEVAKALLSLNINNFAEAKGHLPIGIVGAIAEIEDAEEALRRPPQQILLPINDDRQIPLPFPETARVRAAS